MIKKAVLFAVFLCSSYVSFCQHNTYNEIDSLKSVLENYRNDTIKAIIFETISSLYFDSCSDNDLGLYFAIKGLNLSVELNFKRGIIYGASSIGSCYYKNENYVKSLEYYNIALKVSVEANKERDVANCCQDISQVYAGKLDLIKAQEFSEKALKIYTKIHDSINMVNTIYNIAYYYFLDKNYDSSVANYETALIMATKTKNLTIIGAIYNNLGEIYLKQNKFSLALHYYFKAQESSKDNSKQFLYTIYGNIGEVYLAIAKGAQIIQKTDPLIPTTKSGNLQKAILYLKKGVQGCLENGDLKGVIEFSNYISEACRLSGNYKEALDNYKEYAFLLDSAIKIENRISLSNLEDVHKKELELKNKDIKMQQQQIALDKLVITDKKRTSTFFIFSTLLLFIVVVIIYRSNKLQKRTNKLLKAEKQISENLLLNILPSEVAEELKHKGSAEAKYFENVTVLFTDFVDFTKFAEQLTPQQLVNELNECFKGFDEIIGKYQIEKIKTIGDSYMAVSGVPVINLIHAESIIAAAIEIRDFMHNRKKLLGNKTCDIRLGIHTGEVVAGIVGVKKFAYDIWGDTVNIASRMEQSSQAGKINISETTYTLIKDSYKFTYRGRIDVKNKGQMNMYFVE